MMALSCEGSVRTGRAVSAMCRCTRGTAATAGGAGRVTTACDVGAVGSLIKKVLMTMPRTKNAADRLRPRCWDLGVGNRFLIGPILSVFRGGGCSFVATAAKLLSYSEGPMRATWIGTLAILSPLAVAGMTVEGDRVAVYYGDGGTWTDHDEGACMSMLSLLRGGTFATPAPSVGGVQVRPPRDYRGGARREPTLAGTGRARSSMTSAVEE